MNQRLPLLPLVGALAVVAACQQDAEITVSKDAIVFAPDLIVQSILGPPSVRPYEGFTVETTVCNVGSDYAGSTNTLLVLSPDTTITNTDTFVDTRYVPGLAPGECHTESTFVPGVWLPNGGYYLGALADEPSTQVESDELNNTLAGEQMGFGNGPDLVVTAIDAPPSSDWALDVDVTVCNRGTDPTTSSDVLVILSTDTIIETPTQNPTSADIVVSGGWADSMGPSECRVVSTFGTVGGLQGPYYVAAVVDDVGSIAELIETNNTTVGSLIGLGYGPDLIVTNIDAPPVTDGWFNATVTACNQGTAALFGSDINIYISEDTTIEGVFANPMTPDVLIGAVFVNYINPGSCVEIVGQMSAPPGLNAPFLGALADENDSTIELIESNNAYVGDRIGIGYGPDLIIKRIEGPPSASGGFDVVVEVCNQGNSYANAVDVTLYTSSDTTITGYFNNPASDPPLGSVFFSSMSPGQCATQTTFVQSYVQGAHYLGGIIDESGQVPELNEFNNVFVGALTGFGYGPDLIVSMLSGPPSADGSFTIDATICNQGTTPVGSATAELILSNDTTITSGPGPDFVVGFVNTASLQPMQCETQSVMVSTIGLTGAYYLAAIADPYNSMTELIESNNVYVGELMGLGNGPDLIVSSIAAPPSTTGNFDAVVTLCNQGTAPATNSFVAVVLSTDHNIETIVSNPGTPDVSCGGASVANLQPGQCAATTVPCWAPALGAPHFVAAVADEGNSIVELIESNNVFVGDLIGIGNDADIIVTNIAAPPSANGAIVVDVTACNQGTASAFGFDVTLYVSEDTQIQSAYFGNSTDLIIGNAWFNNLAAGQCATQSVQSWPPPVGAAWYLGAIADESGSVIELIETNNVFVGPRIGLGNAPDLIVTAVSGPPSTTGSFDMTATVCNQGTTPASGADLSLYASDDPTLVSMVNMPWSNDLPLGGTYVPSLQPGECTSITQPVNIWAPGAFYLGAIVDEYDGVWELNEDNNVFVGGRIGVGNGPDFIVTAVGGPPSANGSFLMTYNACNQGTAAGTTDLSFYVSEDAAITTMFESPYGTDQNVGWASVTLAAGACTSGSLSVSAVGQGAYYLGAVADEFDSVFELIDDNNEFVGDRIGLGNGPDLIVDSLTTPPSADGSFLIDYSVCNQGTAPSGSSDVSVYAGSGQPMIASDYVPPLPPDTCHIGSMMGYSQGFGPYQLTMIVDEFSGVAELIEDNNTLVGDLIGFGNGPDLVVNVVSSGAFASPGSNTDVSTTVCNQGTSVSNATDAVIYLSQDQTIVGMSAGAFGDLQVGYAFVPSLAPGQCDSVVNSVSIFVPEGQYYFGAIVDEYDGVYELIEQNNTTLGSAVEVAATYCGNGTIDQMAEECDDGNFVDGDGCSAQCFIEQHVWLDNASGTLLNGPYNWNYAMGYHFRPNRDGVITELGGLFHGTKTVRLFDRVTGAVLAETQVTGQAGSNTAAYASIAPVTVTTGSQYTVAVYLTGTGGTYRRPSAYFPQTFGDVTIESSTYVHTGSDPNRRPTNVYRYAMYGQADITFVPTE